MAENESTPNEQYELVEARMATAMQNMRRWLLVVLCAWASVAVLGIVLAALMIAVEHRFIHETSLMTFAVDMTLGLVNLVTIALYVSGAVAIAYCVQYLYLDRLLTKHQPVAE